MSRFRRGFPRNPNRVFCRGKHPLTDWGRRIGSQQRITYAGRASARARHFWTGRPPNFKGHEPAAQPLSSPNCSGPPPTALVTGSNGCQMPLLTPPIRPRLLPTHPCVWMRFNSSGITRRQIRVEEQGPSGSKWKALDDADKAQKDGEQRWVSVQFVDISQRQETSLVIRFVKAVCVCAYISPNQMGLACRWDSAVPVLSAFQAGDRPELLLCAFSLQKGAYVR